MHEGCNSFTCKSCIWADQCASDFPCEHYHNVRLDETGLSEEEISRRHDEFIANWNELADELYFFDN